MYLTIMIPDNKVSEMLASGKRVDGSIGLANAKEGNFNPYNHADKQIDPNKMEYLLRCGKAVATQDKFTLHLNVKRKNVMIPASIIAKDCKDASKIFKCLED